MAETSANPSEKTRDLLGQNAETTGHKIEIHQWWNRLVDDDARVILFNGGTGITPRREST
jgi:molybdopterin biosynthesis enzyme MoaB